MRDQWIIEHEWDVAKLLITNMDYKMFLFKLPQYGLYLQSLNAVPVAYRERPPGVQIHFGDSKMPQLVVVRTQEQDSVAAFIQCEKQFQAYRIFKHAIHFSSLDKYCIIEFVCNTMKNVLYLFPGRTFRVKSDDVELRKLFYEKGAVINEQDELGCSFDYDDYDYTLDIRKYRRYLDGEFHRWAVITVLSGPGMRNSWNEEMEWWEYLDWNQTKLTWDLLSEEIREDIRAAGLAPVTTTFIYDGTDFI